MYNPALERYRARLRAEVAPPADAPEDPEMVGRWSPCGIHSFPIDGVARELGECPACEVAAAANRAALAIPAEPLLGRLGRT